MLFRLAVAALHLAWLSAAGAAPIVIAHRGASGYLPEHTLEAYALAHGMGADYIEPDLVATRDGHLIALHDIHLEGTTDVESRFPDRARPDGHWYAIDFSLEEIRTLSVHERMEGRFPVGPARFEVPTFVEVIELVQGLNQTTGRSAGLYPELKQPAFHREAGLALEERALKVLSDHGYTDRDAPIFIQSFEPDSLRRLRVELKSPLKLIQLVSTNQRQRALHTEEGLRDIATYADGVGPDKSLLVKRPEYAASARALGLLIHPYTVRRDQLGDGHETMESELRFLFETMRVDGVFTDHPDIAVNFLRGPR